MKFLKALLAIGLMLTCAACEKKYDKSTFKYIDEDLMAVSVDMSAYQGFTDSNHVFKRITFKEALRFFDEQATGIVYYGYSSCPFCVQVVPVLNQVAKEYGLTVYYVDVHGEDKISDADLDRFLELADEFLEHEDGKAQFYVPQVFVFVNGEIIGSHLSAVDSYDPSMGNMTSAQVKELTNIFKKMLKPLK